MNLVKKISEKKIKSIFHFNNTMNGDLVLKIFPACDEGSQVEPFITFDTRPHDSLADVIADKSWQEKYCRRLLCTTRFPSMSEFQHLLTGDELIIRLYLTSPVIQDYGVNDSPVEVVTAICLNDKVLALMIKVAIGDCKLEMAPEPIAPETDSDLLCATGTSQHVGETV